MATNNDSDTFHLISPFVNGQWQPDILHRGNPLGQVRKILGGGWERSKGILADDRAMAAWRGDRRVLVLRMNDGTTQEQAEQALRQIEQDRLRETMS